MLFQPPPFSPVSPLRRPIVPRELPADCLGNLDEFGTVLEGAAPSGWYVRGWAGFSAQPARKLELSIVLMGDQRSYVLDVHRQQRDDVAQAFANQALSQSGYCAVIAPAGLENGSYRLALQLRSGSRRALMSLNQSISVRGSKVGSPSLPAEQPLHVVHVPKTGGTSFRSLLTRGYGAAISYCYGSQTLIAESTRCIQGHTYATTFLPLFPELQLAIWFRDPVERAVSEYYHWQRHDPDSAAKAAFRAAPVGLTEFAARPDQANVHHRVLDGLPLSRFAFVGITEHYQASLDLFSRIFELPPAPAAAENLNPQKPMGAPYQLDEGVRRQLQQINAIDARLYEQARGRFFELCYRHGVRV